MSSQWLRRLGLALVGGLWLICSPRPVWAQIMVVNVIPQVNSNENAQNAEPSVAVGQDATRNPRALISSFNRIPAGGVGVAPAGQNPYFFSSSANSFGFNQWSVTSPIAHSDTTIAWSPGGNVYRAFLTGPDDTNVVTLQRSTPPNPPIAFNTNFNFPAAGTRNLDQPHINVARVSGTDRVYVGLNDLSLANGKSASVLVSNNAGANLTQVPIDRNGGTPIQDGPAVIVASNGNTVYAAYERWNNKVPSGDVNANIMVVRDNRGGLMANGMPNPNGFQDLRTGLLGATIGSTVATVTAPDSLGAGGTLLGANERLGSDLSITVDPRNANTVYVAFDRVVTPPGGGAAVPQVQVYESTLGGADRIPGIGLSSWVNVFNVPTGNPFTLGESLPVTNGSIAESSAISFKDGSSLPPDVVPTQSQVDGLPIFTGSVTVFSFDSIQPVPEPSSLILFGMGGVGLLGYGWRRRKHGQGRRLRHRITYLGTELMQ